jgi:adenylate kinase family enzyme
MNTFPQYKCFAFLYSVSKIVIIGASGSGTSTAGKRLAEALSVPHIETDDLFWLPAETPYTKFRNQQELDVIIEVEVLSKQSWILTGSPCGWGDAIISHLDLAVFLTVPTAIRIERIIKREQQRFGSAIKEGGNMHQEYQNFLAWSKCYDTGGINGRTKALHENWLAQLPCPVLRLEGEMPVDEIAEAVIKFIG